MSFGNHFLENAIGVFVNYRNLAEKSFAQLNNDADFHAVPDKESNSIAVIMKHISGNMISRWTDFLTSDGEKSYRDRDNEFTAGTETRGQLMNDWNAAWTVFMDTLKSLNEDDLMKTVTIRGEGLTVTQAITRQLSHYPYHVGQIVFIAKHIKSSEWKSLSIPKNKSAEHLKGTYLDNLK